MIVFCVCCDTIISGIGFVCCRTVFPVDSVIEFDDNGNGDVAAVR